MSGHTPGPWSLVEDKGHTFSDGFVDHGGFRVDADGVEQLCYVWNLSQRLPLDGKQSDGPKFGSVSGAANARLIAAAPELLDLAREIADNLILSGMEIGERARAAIAKATGAES
jgi:hypothetical protein